MELCLRPLVGLKDRRLAFLHDCLPLKKAWAAKMRAPKDEAFLKMMMPDLEGNKFTVMQCT